MKDLPRDWPSHPGVGAPVALGCALVMALAALAGVAPTPMVAEGEPVGGYWDAASLEEISADGSRQDRPPSSATGGTAPQRLQQEGERMVHVVATAGEKKGVPLAGGGDGGYGAIDGRRR